MMQDHYKTEFLLRKYIITRCIVHIYIVWNMLTLSACVETFCDDSQECLGWINPRHGRVPVLHMNRHNVIVLGKTTGFRRCRLHLKALKCCHDLSNLLSFLIYLLPNLNETHKLLQAVKTLANKVMAILQQDKLQPAATSAVERSLWRSRGISWSVPGPPDNRPPQSCSSPAERILEPASRSHWSPPNSSCKSSDIRDVQTQTVQKNRYAKHRCLREYKPHSSYFVNVIFATFF